MGTTWSVRVAVPARYRLDPLHARIQQRLDGIVQQMSNWEPDSDISRYNRAPAGSWLPLPPDFAHVLECALEVARASGGAFDPTLGTLVRLWGFGPGIADRGQLPEAASLQTQRSRCGWQRLQLEYRDGERVLLQPGGLEIDLSAIAKGYGVDAVLEMLLEEGLDCALVEVGGELRGHGRRPDGNPWRVLVEPAPGDSDGEPPMVLALDDCAVATSGDRWHAFEHGGRRYSHSIDPRTGSPVPDTLAAVTVVAADAVHADAWATALTVLGPEHGAALAERLGLAARFSPTPASGYAPRCTPAFNSRLTA